MKTVKELLQNVCVENIKGSDSINILSIHFDSREVKDGSLFVATKGTTNDGNEFVENAIQKGTKTIVCEKYPDILHENITYILVKDARLALAQIAQNFYGNPGEKLNIIGVTGTNGKTTTVTLLFNLFRSLGYPSAMLSTVENKINDNTSPATHTTPDPIALASFMAEALINKCEYLFMECSSHAIDQKRISGINFRGAVFTNLTHDHLDYHKTIESYAEAKKKLFDNLNENSFALSNFDDDKGEYMVKNTKAKKYLFSLKNKSADFFGEITKHTLDGLEISINKMMVKSKLVGNFNGYNILGIFSVAIILGIKKEKIIEHLLNLPAPKGRLELIKSPDLIYGFVDYAHTPDALENVLETLNDVRKEKSKIITVVGCGGDRDKTKRKPMAEISVKMSDYVFFTSDNPRSEDPEMIIKEMTNNLEEKNFEQVTDRSLAISKACNMAKSFDIVLIAGKGHENYQIFKDRTVHFSDTEELEKNFSLKSK